jgi:hypothetical protein
VKQAEQRWAAYLDNNAAPDLLGGQTLLHTDFNPLNVLIGAGKAWIIDWAWPTRGAAFIDPVCFLLRLMLSGHTAVEAEAWAAHCDSWAAASDKAIDAFAIACARLYAEIAHEDPQPGNSASPPPRITGHCTATWRPGVSREVVSACRLAWASMLWENAVIQGPLMPWDDSASWMLGR